MYNILFSSDKTTCLKASHRRLKRLVNQPVITCPKLTIEALEQGVKYVQS